MKPYRIKHKASGLYYQPITINGNNLSKTGKVYLTDDNILNGIGKFLLISLNVQGEIYKKYGKYFPTLNPYLLDMSGKVAKTEFEIEEL